MNKMKHFPSQQCTTNIIFLEAAWKLFNSSGHIYEGCDVFVDKNAKYGIYTS